MTPAHNHITIIPKPDYISYDDIHELLWKANEKNREKGFILGTSLLNGHQIKERIGEKGRCFVALHNGRLVGTASVRIVERNTWYMKGQIADYCLLGVLPEFQGKHISTYLFNQIKLFSKENNYRIVELDTAEENRKAIETYRHLGFYRVNYVHFKNADHYSVVMAYWITKNIWGVCFSYIYYHFKKIYVRGIVGYLSKQR